MHVYLSMSIAWCASLYQDFNYKKLVKEVGPSDYVELARDEKNRVSSVRVKKGCILNAFTQGGTVPLFATAKNYDNLDTKGKGNQMTGYSCICGGMISSRN